MQSGRQTGRQHPSPLRHSYLVKDVGGAVEGVGAEAERLMHVEDPVQQDGPHLGVQVPLALNVRPGGVLRLHESKWVGVTCER